MTSHRTDSGPGRLAATLASLSLAAAGCDGTMTTSGPDAAEGRVDARAADAFVPPGTDAATAGEDAGTPGTDAGTTSGTAAIFVASGMVGRTTISCDDGRSWVANRAWDTDGDPHLCSGTSPVRCYAAGTSCGWQWFDGSCSTSDGCDCGHSGGFGKGVAFGDGWFVATFGWGYPGAVLRSRDGVTWEETLTNDSFGGIAYGAGRFVLASRMPRHGDGSTWSEPGLADFREADGTVVWSVRRFGYSDYDGGRFVAVASGNNGRDVLVSSDGGESWWRPTTLPDDCAGAGISTYGGIVSGNGVTVIVDQSATACRSTDGGVTWSTTRLADTEVLGHGVWTGTEFWFWGTDGRRYESPDGASWTSTAMVTPRRLGPLAMSDSGTLVATANVWQGYEEQQFLRSTDGGLTWEELPDTAFEAGHAINWITFGRGEPSALCPAR